MTRRSRVARPAARAVDSEGIAPASGADAAADGAPLAGAAAASPSAPPSVAPHWPSSVLFRWEEQAGPSNVWDAPKFPPGGPGVFGRLRAIAVSSKIFRGRTSVPALSAALGTGASCRLLPLEDDEDVENAVRLWAHGPGIVMGAIDVVVREAAIAEEGPVPPLPLLLASGGPQPPRPAPPATALGSALPVEMWMCVLKAVTSSRCVGHPTLSDFHTPSLPLCPLQCRTYYSRRLLLILVAVLSPPAQGCRRAGLRVRPLCCRVQGGPLAPHRAH